MSYRLLTFAPLVLVTIVLVPPALAQKPPTPPPAPSPGPTGGRPSNPSSFPGSDPTQPRDDLVMFIRGRVASRDGAPLPHDMLVERICNNRVRQQVYASSRGDFSMELGSRTDSFPEASADPTSQYQINRRDTETGIPRRELKTCELRASASGFHSSVLSLMDLDPSGENVDVGVIIVRSGTKVEGNTLSALPYKAPKEARKAFEKGVHAEKNGKLDDARKDFETAVQIYPRSANTWFQLGTVLEKQNQPEEARKAFTKATTIDAKFLPPYLSLASMAYAAQNWPEVLSLTDHILGLDPLNQAAVNNYILDLDPLNYVGAYFYNAMANYRLNKINDAERSALKAEHLDLQTHFPQLHLLLADIFVRKNNYPLAIAELQTFLALGPHDQVADQARDQLAKLEKLNAPGPSSAKPDQQQ